MRKLLVPALVASLAACRHGAPAAAPAPAPVPAGGSSVAAANQVGAPDPAGAINAFVSAAKEQNLQAMSALWGTSVRLVRDVDPQAEVEKRLIIMACYLKHDRYALSSGALVAAGARRFTAQMTLGEVTRSSDFTVVSNAAGRWFVQEFELEPLTPMCAKR